MNTSEFEERLRQHGESAVNHISAPFNIESEDLIMNKKKIVKSTILIAASIAIMLGTTVFAAYKLMTPYEIAEKANYGELANVLSAEDTKFDLAPQQCGDYTVELLGITTGKNLSNFTEDFGNEDRSYIIGAISRTDGNPILDYSGMMLTPLISGYKPWEVNIFTLGGGKSEFIENGVDYFVYECDSLEMFADHTIYIAVYGGTSPDGESIGFSPSNDIFAMDSDGSIRFADDYKGQGAIFTVPLDKSKADPQKAEEYLKNVSIYSDSADETDEVDENVSSDAVYFETVEITAD